MLLDQFPHDFPVGGESFDSLGLILAHEATVSFDVSTQNSRELALEGLCGHEITPKMKKPPEGNQSPLEASLSKPSGGVFS